MAAKQLVQPPVASQAFVNAQDSLTPAALGLLNQIRAAINGTISTSGVAQVLLGNGMTISLGSGSPQNAVTGNVGDIYMNSAGGAGTTFFVKESGVGTNTGWVGK